jgi:uncharacterized oligopeptide transporter (OPT) family protein
MVGGFYLLVPDATTLTSGEFPAPAAQSWKAVAELMKDGLKGMHPVYRNGILFGGLLGAVLTLGEQLFPKIRPWWPSATGLGLGLILPFLNPVSMFAGALLAWVWHRAHAKSHDDYMVPMASGVIAGISIIGVLAAFLNNAVLASM